MVNPESDSYVPADTIAASIIAEEGLATHVFPPGVQKSQGLVNASLGLFGFILTDDDPRWTIAHGYQKQVLENGHSDFNFNNAMMAIYLGDNPSRRNGYSTTMSHENFRQLCRALQNLGAHNEMLQRLEATQTDVLPDGAQLDFALTDRVNLGANEEGITGCPEALYQLRLFDDAEYLARVGFNVHTPDSPHTGLPVISITNVQGTPDNQERIKAFRSKAGISPFNLLVEKTKAIAGAHGFRPMALRGLRNPRNEGSAALYNAVFVREGIPRMNFRRPQPFEPKNHKASLAVLFQPRSN